MRKPGDYVTKMIELAGGEYAFSAEDLNVDENALSTMNMDLESFYVLAQDADYLVYNSTIEGELADIAELIEKFPHLADFPAVKEGRVWCTNKNMFQRVTAAGEMIAEFRQILSGEADSLDALTYFYRLK